MSKTLWKDNQRTLKERGFYAGRIDGDPGPMTAGAVRDLLGVCGSRFPVSGSSNGLPPGSQSPATTARSERIYGHALRDNGLKEMPGRASEPRITAAILAAASWLDPDDSKTAWCGCIRGLWGIETGTGVPPEHYRAASWATWGTAVPGGLKNAVQGDTIVMTRTGGNHVCLFVRQDATHVWCFGGNQSDAVNVQKFPKSRVTHVRR